METYSIKAIHPGEILREDVLPALKMSHAKVARLLGISRQTLWGILREKQEITTKMALRLGKLCGNGPTLWISMQCAYNLMQAQMQMAAELDRIPTLSADDRAILAERLKSR